MARGRNRKQGKREKNGRLSRTGQPRYDKGTTRTQAMQELYGQDGVDAIGRAYRVGLLGDGQEAKALLDTARKISNAYWAAYANGRYSCPLGERTYGGTSQIPPQIAAEREGWLSGRIDIINRLGRSHRRAFDQLVINKNPDCGPSWLDAMLTKRMIAPSHAASLELALEALAEIAGVPVPHVVKLRAAA